MSWYVGAGNQTWVLEVQQVFLTIETSFQPLQLLLFFI